MPGGQSTGGDGLFAKGQRVDRYEIREAIGQGGMGAVYRAYDTKLGRMVALKTVVAHRRAGMNEELRQRFMREALAVSKVDHRNVVRVLDFGFTEDGCPFIVMEYLRGQDLGARLRQNGGPLPVELVVDVMLGVCAALRACHEAGIIHRDLKPANIFLADADTGYEVKVLDFGVSKAPLAGDLTEDGQILGTPQYLSPEQVEGRTVPESDQYALGVLIYVCLTTRLPYERHQDITLLRAIELGKFDPPRVHRPDLPPGLEAIILQAMSVSPADRFPSVHALGQRLWEFASPNGREHWRSYYFPATPPPKQKESTTGVPLLAQMARGAPKGPGPTPAAGLAPTEVLMPSTPPARVVAPASGKHPQAFISTKWARPEPPPAEPPAGAPPSAEGSLIDVAGESAIRHALTGTGRSARRGLLLVLGGAAVLAAVFTVRGRPDRAVAPTSTAAVQPAPSVPSEQPAAPRPPEPRTALPAASHPSSETRGIAIPPKTEPAVPVATGKTKSAESKSAEAHELAPHGKRAANDRPNAFPKLGSRTRRAAAKAQLAPRPETAEPKPRPKPGPATDGDRGTTPDGVPIMP